MNENKDDDLIDKDISLITSLIRVYTDEIKNGNMNIDTFKYKKEEVTPAMLLGIADKPFTLDNIIYFM